MLLLTCASIAHFTWLRLLRVLFIGGVKATITRIGFYRVLIVVSNPRIICLHEQSVLLMLVGD